MPLASRRSGATAAWLASAQGLGPGSVAMQHSFAKREARSGAPCFVVWHEELGPNRPDGKPGFADCGCVSGPRRPVQVSVGDCGGCNASLWHPDRRVSFSAEGRQPGPDRAILVGSGTVSMALAEVSQAPGGLTTRRRRFSRRQQPGTEGGARATGPSAARGQRAYVRDDLLPTTWPDGRALLVSDAARCWR